MIDHFHKVRKEIWERMYDSTNINNWSWSQQNQDDHFSWISKEDDIYLTQVSSDDDSEVKENSEDVKDFSDENEYIYWKRYWRMVKR